MTAGNEVDREALEWHLDNAAQHRLARWMDADEPETDDEEEDWECPTCGRRSCQGYCPL